MEHFRKLVRRLAFPKLLDYDNLARTIVAFLARKRSSSLNQNPHRLLFMQSRRVLTGVTPFLSSLLLSSIVGLVAPTILIGIGFSPFLVAMFTLALFALLIDSILTKISLRDSVVEINPVMAFLVKRFGASLALIATRACGLVALTYGLIVLQNPYMLMVIAWLFLMMLLASSCSLLFEATANSKVSKDTN